jgi:hypothetical protein
MENASQTESVTDKSLRTGKVAQADSGVVEIIPGCMRCLIARKDPRCGSVHHHELILNAWGRGQGRSRGDSRTTMPFEPLDRLLQRFFIRSKAPSGKLNSRTDTGVRPGRLRNLVSGYVQATGFPEREHDGGVADEPGADGDGKGGGRLEPATQIQRHRVLSPTAERAGRSAGRTEAVTSME